LSGNSAGGPVRDWQGSDFRKLSKLVFEKTGISLSESTLRRILGRTNYPHLPSEITLNTLAALPDTAGGEILKISLKFHPSTLK
jgi:hypothetical protein